MRTFLKILGFLAILLIIFSIFIASKPSNYEVKRTISLAAPVAVVFNTVNEYKTWLEWGPWIEKYPTITPSFLKKTAGIGGGYSWTSSKEESGSIETVDLTEFSSIEQKIYFGKTDVTDVNWQFTETANGTDVTLVVKGDLDFEDKLNYSLKGGTEKILGKMFEDGLHNLDAYVKNMIDEHSFTNNGMVEFTGGYYIHLTTECSFDEMATKMPEMLSEVINYAIENNYANAGAPFTIYHTFDQENKKSEFSCCVPLRERVNPEGEIGLAFMESGNYHKTTFQGDYKFSEEAWNKAFEYAKEDGFTVPENGKPFEIYTKGKMDAANPAEWITEIYLPVE